jgi:pSer/pThr/pTyr-binding forkhead associated (FHA) protein
MILMKSEVKFGRTDENDISIDHQSVSRQHCRFVLDGGQWKVVDSKSANGVRVNGEEYAVSNIKPGDILELGHLKFRFCAPGEKFKPPPERSEETPNRGMKPTTAELIAGATQPGRGMPGQQAQAKKGPPIALIGGIVGVVVVLGVVAFLVLSPKRTPQPGHETGEDAVKAGDALFKQHKYIAALEKYELAGDAPTPNKKKAADEAKGEEAYDSLKTALDSGDGDKAKNLYERCSSESTYYCQKAMETADPVKALYSKKHLAAAVNAKAAGKLDVCLTEVNLVLAFDSANSDAQALAAHCTPQEKGQVEPAKHEGPSPKEREAKAAKLAKESADKLVGRDFPAAVKAAQAALAQSPTDKTTLGLAYRSLGYGYAYLSDKASAKKWLKQYRPYCSNDCAQVDAFLSAP